MGMKLAVLAICLCASRLALGQTVPSEITNSDVISMTKAGIGEQTIILAIQRAPVRFDTSPNALIALKSAGVSDNVLNTMLSSARNKVQTGGEPLRRSLEERDLRKCTKRFWIKVKPSERFDQSVAEGEVIQSAHRSR